MARSKEVRVQCGLGRANHLAIDTLHVVNTIRDDDDLVLSDTYFGSWPDTELDDCFGDPETIKGRHVVLFSSMRNDRFVTPTVQLVWVMKHHYAARSVVMVAPVFPYRRQDHPDKPHELHRNLWLMGQLKNNGVDTLVLVDPHSPQSIQNAESVGLKVVNVDPTSVHAIATADVVAQVEREQRSLVVLSVDKGSLLRCVLYAKRVGSKVVYYAKLRQDNGSIDIDAPINDEVLAYIAQLRAEYGVEIIFEHCEKYIRDAVVVIREDELDTGGTSTENGWRCRRLGAHKVYLVLSRMICSPGWRRKTGLRPGMESPFDLVFGGNAIYHSYEIMHPKVVPVSLAKPIGHAVAKIIDEL